MPCIKSVLFGAYQLTTIFFTWSTSPTSSFSQSYFSPSVPNVEAASDPVLAFQKELKTLPESSLNAALHANLPQLFKAGMFEQASSALAAVHSSNAPLATSILAAARYELLRRQAGPLGLNNTTTTTTTSPLVVATTTSSTQNAVTTSKPLTTQTNIAVIIPQTLTTTNPSGSVITSTNLLLAPTTADTSIAVTIISTSSGTTLTQTTLVPAVIVSNPSGQVTASPLPTVLSNGGVVLTTTNDQGSTVVTTITPTGIVSSAFLVTTTLPDGVLSTSTSYVVVPANKPTSSAQVPKLQGAAVREKPSKIGLLGVLVMGMLFGGWLL